MCAIRGNGRVETGQRLVTNNIRLCSFGVLEQVLIDESPQYPHLRRSCQLRVFYGLVHQSLGSFQVTILVLLVGFSQKIALREC